MNEQDFDNYKPEHKSLYKKISSKVSGKIKRKLIILIILVIFLVLAVLLILKKTGHLDLFHRTKEEDDKLPSVIKKDEKLINEVNEEVNKKVNKMKSLSSKKSKAIVEDNPTEQKLSEKRKKELADIIDDSDEISKLVGLK